jgi:hypothetical protein
MVTTDISAADDATLPSNPQAAPVGWAWVLRRSVLLAAILFAGVLGACLLYAAASNAESRRGAASPVSAQAMPI